MPVAPSSAEALLELCRKSGLVEEADLRRLLQTVKIPSDPHKAACELIRAGILTRYQAGHLLAGKYRGFRFGRYKILQELGRGGSGTVVLCEHVVLRRQVAIKVLPLGADRAKFLREAYASEMLDHPNIVRTIDVGCEDGFHFLV